MESTFSQQHKMATSDESYRYSSSPCASYLQLSALNPSLVTPELIPEVDLKVITPDIRLSVIAERIKDYFADFTCIQEVDSPDRYFYENILSSKGFKSIFHRKHDQSDGLCLIYNAGKFTLFQSHTETYHYKDDGKMYTWTYQIQVFKQKWYMNSFMLVGLTHLKAKCESKEMRIEQANQLSKAIANLKELLTDKDTKVTIGIIICGDFNDESGNELSKTLLEDHKLQSAFADVQYTNIKIKDTGYRKVNDYILFNDQLRLMTKSSVAHWETIGEFGSPNKDYPLNHLSLYVVFECLNLLKDTW
jgi:mRNA deadenylase 3'-5' endonuclease subunit Ccr4